MLSGRITPEYKPLRNHFVNENIKNQFQLLARGRGRKKRVADELLSKGGYHITCPLRCISSISANNRQSVYHYRNRGII